MKTELPKEIADHIRAVSTHDVDVATAPFADDACVNDVEREIVGNEAIRELSAKEIVSVSVTYKRDGLPDPLILTNYFSVAAIILNKPSPYA